MMNDAKLDDQIEAPRLSTGDPSTLGSYLKMGKAIAPDSKFVAMIEQKVADSPNGEEEIVVAAESQMMYLLGQMLDLAPAKAQGET